MEFLKYRITSYFKYESFKEIFSDLRSKRVMKNIVYKKW